MFPWRIHVYAIITYIYHRFASQMYVNTPFSMDPFLTLDFSVDCFVYVYVELPCYISLKRPKWWSKYSGSWWIRKSLGFGTRYTIRLKHAIPVYSCTNNKCIANVIWHIVTDEVVSSMVWLLSSIYFFGDGYSIHEELLYHLESTRMGWHHLIRALT